MQGPHGETGTLHHRDSGKEGEAGARDEQDRGTHDFTDAPVSQLEDRQNFEFHRYQSGRSPGHFVSDDSRGGEPSQESCCPKETGDGRSRQGADPCPKPSLNVAHQTPQIEDSTKKVDFSAVVECVELPSVGSSDEETLQDSVVPEDLHDYSAFEMMHSCSSLTQKTDFQTKIQKPKKKNSTMNRSLKENHQKQKKKNSATLQSHNDNEEFFEDYSAFRSGSSTTNALPWNIAKALLAMMTLLTATANENLRNLVRGNQVDVWEMFCSPHSFLTQACESEGLHCSRINLDNHYDLYRRQTYDALFQKVKKERPKRIWVSTRCTYWCPWTSLNYNTEEKWAKLEGYRRKERGMFRLLFPFLESALIEDDSTDLFMEWPTRCQGWNEPLFLNFQARLQQAGRPLWFCRIDGCRYGLRSSSGGFLKKSWTIATTSQTFYHLYKMKTCVGNHAHDHIQGIETARSAYYPWRMVKSISQTWRKELFPERRLSLLHAPLPQHSSCAVLDLHAGELADEDQDEVGGGQDNAPTQREQDQWMVQLKKYHRASGHPNNFNLARILRDAGLEKWKVDAASSLHCDECAALKLGGDSSGKIPPASMRPMPKAWEVVGMDCTEWNPPGTKKKFKILVMMDLATRFKVTSTLLTYELYEMKQESTDQLLNAFCSRWLADKPKPLVLVPDNAKSMTSAHMRQVLSDLNIQIDPPAAKESWAHGLMERAVQETKNVANKIHLANPPLNPQTSLALATHAMNATEHVSGFTPLQWVYGKQFTFSEEDERVISQMMPEARDRDFTQLMAARSQAEDVARKVRAQQTLSKLRNSKVRQPLQTFQAMDLVKIWRKYSQDGGPRGGLKRLGKSQWLGPGRVVFHEMIQGQRPDDPRRHIVWVVVAGSMHRCSVHSVRKVTERERLEFELHSPEDPSTWKSLADMLPRRSYIDITAEEPDNQEEEVPNLPLQPDPETILFQPRFRHRSKSGPLPGEALPPVPEDAASPVNEYSPSIAPASPLAFDDEEADEGIGSGLPTLAERSGARSSQDRLLSETSKRSSASSEAADLKRQRTEDAETLLFNCLEICEEGYLLTVDLEFDSNWEEKRFLHHPTLYLAQKLRDCEVRFEKLRPEHKTLFNRAKTKEVNSFIANQAVRRCLNAQEEIEAKESGRLMRCRWVLTWKPTPQESLEEAQQEVKEKPEATTFTKDGSKKAKARIVLLGFEHPDLLSEEHRTSSPVQAVLTRNMSYQLVVENGWDIEGIDMSTAFLQTLPTEEQKRLWTTGVKELREALQIPEGGVLRILKDFYGSTTAPKNLYQNVDQSMKNLGALKIKGDQCFWLWVEKESSPNSQQAQWKTIGFMAGHVDDFHRAGDKNNPRWNEVRASIDKMYKWGSVKTNQYRHAGTDLTMTNDSAFGRCLVIDQSYYIDSIQDVQIAPDRFSKSDSSLTPKEITECRASLGALQWVAVQTQPLVCARCNLLLTELSTDPKMTIAQEIQEMIRELRKSSTVLKFFKLPGVTSWRDLVVVGLGDQAHNNRPNCGSTGGMLIFLCGPQIMRGNPNPMILVYWKTWKLKRKSIGTNDAEVQSLVEAEDALFRSRLLWAEMNGAGAYDDSRDLLEASVNEVKLISGLLGTDSKGGYDSIIVNESPLLGLSNTRAALQAHQLKESLPLCGTKLIWLASDWNLADGLTKKKKECRESLEYFLRKRVWMLRFDPEFIRSAKKERQAKGSPIQQLRTEASGVLNSQEFWAHAIHDFPSYI